MSDIDFRLEPEDVDYSVFFLPTRIVWPEFENFINGSDDE